MGKRNTSEKFRNQVIELHGAKCVNCGSDDAIEFHHIVPIALGGTDALTNVVPLCYKCHKAAHTGRRKGEIIKETKGSVGGRKRKCDEAVFEDAFKKYIEGRIGKTKFCELTGRKGKSFSAHFPQFEEAKERHGIKEFRNNIDIRGTISAKRLEDGDPVGYIRYLDGREETMLYHDTGDNDVDYTRLHLSAEEKAEIRKNESEAEREERKKNYNDFQRTLDKILNAS